MKPSEIYSWKPIYIDKNENILYNTFLEYCRFKYDDFFSTCNKFVIDAFEIKYYVKEFWDDGDFIFYFGSLWFKEKPIAIIRVSGEYDYDCFITDKINFMQSVEYIKSFIPSDEIYIYDSEDEITNLNYFYGLNILDFYDPKTGEVLKHIDDIMEI